MDDAQLTARLCELDAFLDRMCEDLLNDPQRRAAFLARFDGNIGPADPRFDPPKYPDIE